MCLVCEATESKSIANLASLTELYCSWCTALQSIPKELVTLTSLHCSGCTALQSIPKELVNLKILYCRDCTALQSIPIELVNLKILYCSGCTALKSIPKELTKLTILYCYGCMMLYIPSIIAKKFNKKSRGGRIRDWIYRSRYRAARNAEKRVALTILQNIVSGNSKVFDRNVVDIFNRVRV
jgi:hypothetical protein